MEKNISKLKSRILEYAEYRNFSKRKIYLDTGISNGVLDKKTGLTEDNIEKFISTYKDVNPNWFLIGQGEMLVLDEKQKEKLGDKNALADYLEKKVEEKEERIKELQENLTNAKEIIASLRTELNFKTGYEDNRNKNT